MRDAQGSHQALTAIQAGLVTLSAAIASGDATSVEHEAERAATVGVSHAALYEAVLQSYLFVGFPRAIEAFFATRPVLQTLGAHPVDAAPFDIPNWKRSDRVRSRRQSRSTRR